MKEYYSIKEFAEYFSLSFRTIESWVANNKIKYIKVGKSVRIPKEEVERLKKGE